jgi:hypothetical protein
MKEITKSDFDNVVLPAKSEVEIKTNKSLQLVTGITEEELAELERQSNVPVNLQRSLVAKLGAYTDYCIGKDLAEKSYITDHTKKFIELYNNTLTILHKEIYGDKQVSVGTLKVTHSMIMNEVRKSSKIIDAEFKEEN